MREPTYKASRLEGQLRDSCAFVVRVHESNENEGDKCNQQHSFRFLLNELALKSFKTIFDNLQFALGHFLLREPLCARFVHLLLLQLFNQLLLSQRVLH